MAAFMNLLLQNDEFQIAKLLLLLLLLLLLFFFFFFFFCRYNPLWVLAFSVIFFHSALSLHNILHPLIPIICISSSMSSIHLFLGLPLFLLPIDFHSTTLLGVVSLGIFP